MRKTFYLLILLLPAGCYLNAQNTGGNGFPLSSLFSEKSNLFIYSDFSGSPNLSSSGLPYFQLSQMAVMRNRDDFLSRLKDKSHFGASVNNSLIYVSRKNNFAGFNDLRFVISLENRYDQNVVATAGLTNLFFKGNAEFAGENIQLSPFYYYAAFTQSLGFSVFKQLADETGSTIFGGGVSFVLSGYYNETAIKKGNLFTSIAGDSLYLAAEFEMLSSTPAYSNDKGFELNFFYGKKKEDLRYGISISNLGILFLSAGHYNIKIDTQLSYTGFDLINNSSSGSNSILDFVDTFKNISPAKTPGKVVLYPRVKAYAEKKNVFWNSSVWAFADWRFGYHYLPALGAGMTKEVVKEKLLITTGLNSDFYGHGGLLIKISYRPLNKLSVSLGTRHLESPLLFRFNGFNLAGGLKWEF